MAATERLRQPLLSRLRHRLEQRRALPHPHSPPKATPEERRRWLLLMGACWLTMAGALLAASALLSSEVLLLEMIVLVAFAFPVVWRLHFSTFPRFWVNQASFLLALILGIIEWRMGIFTGGRAASGLVLSYRTLVGLFYWVMVFRAFAIRSVRDLTLTALPAISGLLLLLIAAPTPIAFVGTALVVAGTLAMLAGEHATHRADDIDEVIAPASVSGGRWRPRLNSWVSLLVAAAITATIIAGVAARIEPSNPVGQWMRRQLAWRIARLMIGERYMPYGLTRSLSLTEGAPEPRDQLMLIVESESPLKIRTTAYDIYLGREWEQSKREWVRLRRPPGPWELPPPETFGLSSLVTEEMRVRITPRYSFIGTLPVPWCPRELTLSTPSIRYDRSGMVLFNGYLGPGDTYEVLAATPSALTAPEGAPPPPRVDLEHALQLPDDVTDRVRHLTERIVADTSGRPVEIAIAIENYLRTTYEYDLETPPLPEGVDYVDHFLFVGRRGWCNHYASAMVVMMRIAGVPSRLATGFTAGEWIPEEQHFEIRDQDAHAWAEVYLPDSGWVDFDPTPSDTEPETVTEGLTDALGRIGTGLLKAGRWLRANLLLSLAMALLLAAAVAGGLLGYRWYRRRLRPLRSGAGAEERVIYAYRQALRWLAGEGIERPQVAAPWEFHRLVAQERPLLAEDLSLLTSAYAQARFGAQPPPETMADRTEQALARLRDLIFAPGDRQEGAVG